MNAQHPEVRALLQKVSDAVAKEGQRLNPTERSRLFANSIAPILQFAEKVELSSAPPAHEPKEATFGLDRALEGLP